MMERSRLSLIFVGPAVESGEMDAYEAGASIMAFGDFLGIVSQAAYGDKVKTKTTVNGVRPGSFEIDFAVHAVGIATTIFSGIIGPKDLLELFKQSIDLWKFLRGEPPKQFHIEGDKLVVENNYGTINYFRADVGKIVVDERAGEAVGRFIRKNLESGVDEVIVKHEQETIADVKKDEARSFTPIPFELPFTKNTVIIGLVIESAVFKEGNMWRFFDGQTSFAAPIDDQEFLAKVKAGEERFGNGDILTVELEITQTRTLSTLKTERRIKEVLKHQTVKQEGLFGDDR
jgi:hypothetical protein